MFDETLCHIPKKTSFEIHVIIKKYFILTRAPSLSIWAMPGAFGTCKAMIIFIKISRYLYFTCNSELIP